MPTAASSPPAPATTKHTQQQLPPDRSITLPTRQLDAARLRELKAQREFRYVEPDASTDAWDAFWARVWRWLGRLLGKPSPNSHTGARLAWKYGFYAAVLGVLAFAVLKLLQVDITGAFGRSARRGLAYDTTTEDIHEVDFTARIAEAEAAGNFRLATRLGYLEVLKHLTVRGHIQWQPDKTNHAYLAELAAGSLREAFRGATRQFEYVWYGELRLNAALYQQARAGQRTVSALLASKQPTGHEAIVSPNTLPA
ncbi:DUF4129 domain-containing protein [Hymenobacter sp. BT770]|uniref:DUF4129 domain-containing protein n=1 Tax=Hymenobacter sp. BT770 TaxID=2886942 RepID=UPI001D11B9BF|nr:DUF4129 domain-containing protein [Hymenobacter sp. BT770]MCC3152689.1 DUF4129 domain-containing protein [Hymenobacter sp. BT770]MDO3414762.1 DUF4129 domain-containing protein [Hymenobacter sp. BT770]